VIDHDTEALRRRSKPGDRDPQCLGARCVV